jgi:Ni2+-binding GTPase involved in maturation of urease and hydrogenase
MHRVRVRVVEDALDANNTIAAANRADFDRAGVAVVNFMGAPGAGKTALLERVLHDLGDVRAGVLEGDVQGSMDADRLASLHVPVTQLNTGAGFGGECHLDANMVRSAIPALPLEAIDLLPHVDYDVEKFLANLEAVHPGVASLPVSARTGEGMAAWRDWLAAAGRRAALGATA